MRTGKIQKLGRSVVRVTVTGDHVHFGKRRSWAKCPLAL
jgi:hypothetical protein